MDPRLLHRGGGLLAIVFREAVEKVRSRGRRFFVKEHDEVYRLVKEIRESVVLAQQDVIRDSPFTRMDLVVCRNLLIYLDPRIQRRLITLFHYSLRPAGLLFLGTSETLCGLTGLFSPVEQKLRIYSRMEGAARADTTGLASVGLPAEPVPGPRETARTQPSLQTAADELVLRQFGSPAVLVSAQGDILYLNGRTGNPERLRPAGRPQLRARGWLRRTRGQAALARGPGGAAPVTRGTPALSGAAWAPAARRSRSYCSATRRVLTGDVPFTVPVRSPLALETSPPQLGGGRTPCPPCQNGGP